MSFGSYHFENSNDVLKALSFALPTTEPLQQQQHLSDTAEIDFFHDVDNFSTQQHDQHPTSMHIDTPSSSGGFVNQYNALQHTSGGNENIQHTNNSVLAGYNPDYSMSPLQISAHTSNGTFQQPSTALDIEDTTGFGDDEDFFSPLISPAIAPAHDRMHRMSSADGGVSGSNNNNNNNMMDLTFSPLTSPALHSVSYQTAIKSNGTYTDPNLNQINTELLPESELQRKLALIEEQQNILRSAQRQLQSHPLQLGNSNSGLTIATATSPTNTMPMTVIESIALTTTPTPSPAVTSNLRPHHAPVTPSLLMRLGRGDGIGSTTPSTTPSNLASAAVVDNMALLPAAMLEDKPPTSKSVTPKKHPLPGIYKRPRISRAPSGEFSPPGLHPTAILSPQVNTTDQTLSALLSPAALRPRISGSATLFNSSAAAAAAAGIASSPRALKPLISPSLNPNGKRLSLLEEQAVAAALATKSNYQNMREGIAKNLGIDFSSSVKSGVESRRWAHKAAEQKRRDTLKQYFESLRKEIASTMVNSDGSNGSGSGSGKEDGTTEEELKERVGNQMSKVVLIQQSYEYILRLKAENRRKDDELKKLRDEVEALKNKLNETTKGLEKSIPSPTPPPAGEEFSE